MKVVWRGGGAPEHNEEREVEHKVEHQVKRGKIIEMMSDACLGVKRYLECNLSYGNKLVAVYIWHGCLLLKISRRLLQVVW